MVTDFRLAFRSLARAPIFAAAVIFTVALGVGATTSIFSVVYTALYRPLPYPDADRLVAVWQTRPRNPKAADQEMDARVAGRIFVATPLLDVWRHNLGAFEDIAGFRDTQFTLTGAGEPVRIRGAVVTASLFKVLGVRPAIGRLFRPGEDQPGHDEVIVLGYQFWKEHFGGDPGAIGKTVRIGGVPHVVIGVLQADTRLPLQYGSDLPALYTPMSHEYTPKMHFSVLLCVGRLKPGKTVAAAQSEISALMHHLGTTRLFSARIAPLMDEVVGTNFDAQHGLFILMAATICVLLIGCVNVASLLLVRAATRHRELAIRTALGASYWRVIRQVVSESLMLSIAGGGVGLLFAAWGSDLLLAVMPEGQFPRLQEVRLDGTVLAFGIIASVVAGLLAGVVPAWYVLGRERRGRLADALKENQRAATGGRGTVFVRRILVGAQVVLAMVLLVGAGLLARTYFDAVHADFGVRPDHLLTFRVGLDAAKYPQAHARAAFAADLLARIRAIPSVRAAGVATAMPVASYVSGGGPSAIDGVPMDAEQASDTGANYVTAGFFESAGISLVSGRWFASGNAPDAVVVSRAFARRAWPDGPVWRAIGHTVTVVDKVYPIIGVVENVKYSGARDPHGEDIYVPFADTLFDVASVLVRTAGEPMASVPDVRRAVRAIDADMPLDDVMSLEQIIGRSATGPRFRTTVIGAFALLALLLAMVGLYGVVAQSVLQRTQEIGVRLALGAGRGRIVVMVMKEALLVVTLGIAGGIAASSASARLLSSYLFGVKPSDATTYALVAVVLLAVAVVACLMPARHASAIDPVVALRNE